MPEIVYKVAHWPEIAARVSEFRDNARIAMENASTEKDMWKAQGAIKAFNAMLNLPEALPFLKGEID